MFGTLAVEGSVIKLVADHRKHHVFTDEELLSYRQSLGSVPAKAPVFPTRTGKRRSTDNVRARVIAPAVRRANELRDVSGGSPLPPGVTPHTLRRTFISFLLEAGASPRYVMGQVGHTDPKTTLRIYAHLLKRDRSGVGTALDELIHGSALPAPTTKISALQSDGGGLPIADEATVLGPENGQRHRLTVNVGTGNSG